MKTISRAYKDRLKGHKDAVLALYTPDGPEGSRLISASADGMVRFWNVKQRERETKFTIRKPGSAAQLLCYLFRPTGLFAGYADSTLAAFDLETGMFMFALEGHEGSVNTLDADEKAVYSGAQDRTVRVWAPLTGECILMFQFSDPVSVLKLSTDACTMYVGTWDKVLRKVDLRSQEVREVILAAGDVIRAILATDTHVFVGGCDQVIRAWDLTTLEPKTMKGHTAWVLGLRIYKEYLYSYSDDRTIRVWDMISGKCVEEFCGHEDAVTALEFVGDVMYSASLDHSIRTWDLKEMRARIEERACMIQDDMYSWKLYVYLKTVESRRKGKKGKKGKRMKSKGKKGKKGRKGKR